MQLFEVGMNFDTDGKAKITPNASEALLNKKGNHMI
jgi:hypothetical protein